MFRPTARQIAAAAHLGWDYTPGRGLEYPYSIFHTKSRHSRKHVKFMLDVAIADIFSQYGPKHDEGRKKLRGSVNGFDTTTIPAGSIHVINEALQARYRGTVNRFASRTPEFRNVSNEGDILMFFKCYFAIVRTDDSDRPQNPAPTYIVSSSYKGGLTLAERTFQLQELERRASEFVDNLVAEGAI